MKHLLGMTALALSALTNTAHAATCNTRICEQVDRLTGEAWCDTTQFPDYQDWSACEKQEYLWWNVSQQPYSPLPPMTGNALDAANLFSAAYLSVTFDHESDWMPSDRKKLLHGFGATAKFDFIPVSGASYTGVFKGGFGLMRLSLAADEKSLGFAPGMALKFLIDGQPSANIMVMYSLDGQGTDRNFFSNSFSNKIAPPKNGALKLLVPVFKKVLSDPFYLSLEHMARYQTNGLAARHAKAPYQIILVPTSQARAVMTSTNREDVRKNFAKIQPGTAIYTVTAIEREGDAPVVIGRIVSSSRFVASKYQDERLFFQHFRP